MENTLKHAKVYHLRKIHDFIMQTQTFKSLDFFAIPHIVTSIIGFKLFSKPALFHQKMNEWMNDLIN